MAQQARDDGSAEMVLKDDRQSGRKSRTILRAMMLQHKLKGKQNVLFLYNPTADCQHTVGGENEGGAMEPTGN